MIQFSMRATTICAAGLILLMRHDAEAWTPQSSRSASVLTKGHALDASAASASGTRANKSSWLTPRRYRDRHEEEEVFTHQPRTSVSATVTATPGNTRESSGEKPASKNIQESPILTGGINFDILKSLGISQALVFVAASAATGAFLHGDANALQWTPGVAEWSVANGLVPQVVTGFAAAFPMVYLSRALEQSNNRHASEVNFATTNTVISLFGRRRFLHDGHAATHSSEGESSTAAVVLVGLGLAAMTAITEETVFRLFLPALTVHFSQSVVLAIGIQAALFGLGHLNPGGRSGENILVGGLQVTNALWYAVIFYATGNLVPCIIAHTLYDVHVLTENWHSVNSQIDYTDVSFPNGLSEYEEAEISQIQRESGNALTDETLAFCRRFFYAFDYDHQGSLSLPDVQRAVAYAFLQDKVIPEEQEVQRLFRILVLNREIPGDERLRLPEFLRLLFTLRSQSVSLAQNESASP